MNMLYFIGRADVEAETPILWPPDAKKYSALFAAVKQKSSNMENYKRDHGVNREYMGVCVQLRGTLNIRGRGMDLILHAKLLQSCQTLCDTMDCSPPGSSVHGTLQAKILEWVAISSSRRSSQPRDRTYVSYVWHWQAGLFPLAPPGKLFFYGW